MKPSELISDIVRLTGNLGRVIFPDVCTVCHRSLVEGERYICLGCLMDLPRTNFHKTTDNSLTDRLFSPSLPIEKAGAMFYYRRDNPYVSIIHATKYHGRPKVGRHLAALHAEELLAAGFFHDIDLLVPVPLHFLKQLKRGYNQAGEIAEALSEVCDLPVVDALKASWHRSQTRQDAHGRFRNASDVYSVKNPELICDRHVLLVDDVITTGSTILACVRAIRQVSPTTRVSVYSLAATQLG